MGLENIMIIVNLLVISLLGINLKTYILLKKECKLNISKKIKKNCSKVGVYDRVDISKILLKYENCILKFIKVLIENFNKKDLVLFFNNINTLKIIEKKSILEEGFEGAYVGNKNIIEVTNDFEESIYHELFHMASNMFSNKIDYCGFSQLSDNLRIGVGLNEGYTELLTYRYFPQKYKSNSYDNEMKYASLLEKIIGIEKMQSLYLNANLNGLIEELRKYTNKENIIQFIKDIDFISKYKDDINNKFTFFYKNYLINSYKNINMFLIKCYTKKLLLETNLSNKEIRQNIMSFMGLFPASIIIKNENKCDEYKIVDDKEFYKYIVKIEKLIEQYRLEENIK